MLPTLPNPLRQRSAASCLASRALALMCAVGLLKVSSASAQDSMALPVDAPQLRQPEAIEPLPLPPPGVGVPCEVTLVDLEEMALANNPTLGVAWARINAARGRQVQSGLYPNPMFGYTGQDMGEDGTAGQQGGYVGQQFITGKKLQLNRAIGGREVLEQQFLFDAQELRILSDVRLRYYEALVAQRRIELTAELVAISEKLAQSSRQLLESKLISENDLLQAEIELEEAQILANNAQNDMLEAWRRLAAVVGIPALQPARLGGALDAELPTYEWEEAYSLVLGQHPQISAAVARVERARIAIDRARRENIPDVNVMAMLTHMNQTGDDVVGVQAGIPIPVLNRNQGRIMETQAELVAAQNSIARIELELQDRLAMAFRRYANARQQTDRYREQILPRAQTSIELVGNGYRQGQVDFLTLLTSQRTYIRVNLAFLEALAELRQATTLIEGQLLADSLQQE